MVQAYWKGLARLLFAMTPYNQSSASHGPAAINILDVLRGILRRKLFIAGLTLAAFGLGLGLVKVLKPIYTSEAQILIQNLETPFDRFQSAENSRGDTVDDRMVASQMSVIRSDDLGRRVIAALGLENDPEFNPLIRGIGTFGRIRIALGFGSDPALKTPEQRALDHYASELSVFQLPQSNVIGIKYSSSNPETAAKVANTLAETYVMWTREAQSQPTERARVWLAAQIEALRRKLAQSEEAVERFRAEAGLLQGTTATLGEQEISELNSQITVARASAVEARARADAIRDMLASRGNVETAADVLTSAVVQRLKEQRAEAVRRMAELSATYLDSHPRMVAVKTEIANIDRQIRAEALKVVASLDEQASVAEARQKSLEASLAELKKKESTANLDDVRLKALEREVAADRALLETMLSRYAEASARQERSAQPGLGVIIQSAAVSAAPSFPKPGPMVLLITLAGFSFALGLAFLMELMRAATGVSDMPERVTDEAVAGSDPPSGPHARPAASQVTLGPTSHPQSSAPPLAVTPQQSATTWQPPPAPEVRQYLTVWPRIVPHGDMAGITSVSEVAAAARCMAEWASALRRDHGIRRVGITSVGGGTADSPVAALAMARSLALTGHRAVLVDVARMGAFLGGLCGVPQGPGLSDLVSGKVDFTKVIARDLRSTVHVLRFGLDHSDDAARLIRERLGAVLDALAKSYDYCIVHLGEATDETPIHLHKCEAALILAPATQLVEATKAVQTLLSTGLSAAQHVLIGAPLQPAEVDDRVQPMTVAG